jgi:5-methylcytosine-specific restriction endonuclease McrA
MLVPSVCILKEQIKIKRRKRLDDNGGPSSNLLFLRDNFTCQYCGNIFPRSQLTQDHVLPRKFGGRTTWNNMTSSCGPCNNKRGHDVRMKPANRPYRPTYEQLNKMARKYPVTMAVIEWNYYLGWLPELVEIVRPRSAK